ncbi:NAD kinase [bacterium]|nr:NAD kinase [bacterium]
MLLAVYARRLDDTEVNTLKQLILHTHNRGISLIFHKNLEPGLKTHKEILIDKPVYFSTTKQLAGLMPQVFISVGGDGTLLDSILYVKDLGIPVLGINTGRLGFLSNTSPGELETAIDQIAASAYSLEPRTLLETTVKGQNSYTTYSLNDVSLHKRDTSAMITIHASLNGAFFNTYWADGLLVSTPTGSTAYSLSCGGPILFPDAKSLLITPVAPHNLNVRPIIVSDDSIVEMKIEGRGTNFLMAFDSRNKVVDYQCLIKIKKAHFVLNLVKFNEKTFVNTLQDKLNWGKDNRNLAEQNTYI